MSAKKRARRGPAPAPRAGELFVEPARRLTDAELPRCAVVILNWNGRHHLAGCFDSLAAMDYPKERLEVVLVDNGSRDGSVAEVRARHPWVRLAANERNVGFSAGCNQGARAAEGAEVLVFLNNDIRVEPDFLRWLVAPIVRGAAVATSARMLSWDGERMNSAGGGMNFHGIGIQRGYEEPPAPHFERPCRTLFACGGAMAMAAAAFEEVGGFDEEFFAYYEDVDLGWRSWVLGHEVHYEPRAVCYHHHSSTSGRVDRERVRLIQVRNPLLACVKNYDDGHLRQVLPAALALAQRRAWLHLGPIDERDYRIEAVQDLAPPTRLAALRRRLRGRARDEQRVRRVGVADLLALQDLLGRWRHWMERRAEVQSRRRRPDAEIFRLFLRPLWCIEDEPAYRELHEGISAFTGIQALFEGLTSLDQDPKR